jgi:hypothetical protein
MFGLNTSEENRQCDCRPGGSYFVFVTKYYKGNQAWDIEKGRACTTHWQMIIVYEISMRKPGG